MDAVPNGTSPALVAPFGFSLALLSLRCQRVPFASQSGFFVVSPFRLGPVDAPVLSGFSCNLGKCNLVSYTVSGRRAS